MREPKHSFIAVINRPLLNGRKVIYGLIYELYEINYNYFSTINKMVVFDQPGKKISAQ